MHPPRPCGLLRRLRRRAIAELAQTGVMTDIAVLVDEFPARSQTFVGNEAAALARLGHRVTVEARERPDDPGAAPDALPVRYVADEPAAAQLLALAWLAARHPRR